MSISSVFRFVFIGSFCIRNRAGKASDSVFVVSDLISFFYRRFSGGNFVREYSCGSRIMWCEKVCSYRDFYCLLVNIANKKVSDFSLVNFSSLKSRDVYKEEDEGGIYTSHVLIKKEPDEVGRHVILIERVPGVYVSSLRDYLNWVCNDESYKKEVVSGAGGKRMVRAVCDIDGCQSKKIKDALREGRLEGSALTDRVLNLSMCLASHNESHAHLGVVVMNEVPECTKMVFLVLRERERLSHQAGDTLPECTVKPFDMVGFPL